ncbi:MAG: sigma-70 family RNA polymerase sigma factor [Bradymonadaceae bacterium]
MDMISLSEFNRSEDDESKMAAFEDAAMVHLNDLYAKALQYTKNEKDAEDLVQETFVKAYDNWDRFEEGTNCRAWLFTILRNTFINRYRRQKREREILDSDETTSVEKNFFDRERTNYYESPESETLSKTFSEDLQSSLASLPEEFRRVVVLADLNDFSYKEIAYILDCPVGTVMSRLFRGRKLMRQELADAAYDRGIIRETEPFMHEETNRTRASVRDRKMGERDDD